MSPLCHPQRRGQTVGCALKLPFEERFPAQGGDQGKVRFYLHVGEKNCETGLGHHAGESSLQLSSRYWRYRRAFWEA